MPIIYFRLIREALGLSRQALAALVGVSALRLTNAEQGRGNLNFSETLCLARVLGYPNTDAGRLLLPVGLVDPSTGERLKLPSEPGYGAHPEPAPPAVPVVVTSPAPDAEAGDASKHINLFDQFDPS